MGCEVRRAGDLGVLIFFPHDDGKVPFEPMAAAVSWVAEATESMTGEERVNTWYAVIGTRYHVHSVEPFHIGSLSVTPSQSAATAALVASDEDLTGLMADYKVRSKFVHQGVLPGSEPRRGSMQDFDPHTVDAVRRYEHEALPRLRRTARGVLEMALSGRLPRRTTLDPQMS